MTGAPVHTHVQGGDLILPFTPRDEEEVMGEKTMRLDVDLGMENPGDGHPVRDWMLFRPSGEDTWLVLGPASADPTWQLFRDELRAQQEGGEGLPLEVRTVEMTTAEVASLDEFRGW